MENHIILQDISVREALVKLDKLGADAILFIVNDSTILMGSLTDGDIRRGIINGLSLEDPIMSFIQNDPKFILKTKFSIETLKNWRDLNFKIIPVLNDNKEIIELINFRKQRSFLPIDAVIMAGGKGARLRPQTLTTPKPLLKIGNKPIIEYNIDRLKDFGIKNQTISISYLGEQLIDYFKDGSHKNLNIQYITEDKPLGTIGAVRSIKSFYNDYILVMNSDILSNINFEDMFKSMLDKNADMIVATSPYEVNIPYGVIETDGDNIINLQEKPTYTYYSNAGIYIFKREHLNLIPEGNHFNATDLMEALYSNNKSVLNFPITGYWLDIGKPHDFEKAEKDVAHINWD